MMVHGIYWDPKCMPCYYPWECLLFIECALGPVKLGTDVDMEV